ncbi:LytR C-terminal domain-containing protein [Bifidobacterium samirii]|uniref:Cell wall integrity and stress response protein 1 n=1 Tax=Bifidobacterium samirii TaxID=2306974 RepID=A0A430FPD0_9BIFI|nr:LytR C-terminal domain-containing protein [Bifidobacterium samirii]RSX54687.1 cell wall integrity and stress response protein 1 [Bifidobacterium samirii]
MTKNDKATYESYDRDEFDEPPVGPVGVHRGSRSVASRVLPYVVVLVVAALVGALAWGVSTGELGKMIESWRPTQSQQADADKKADSDEEDDADTSDDADADKDADASSDGAQSDGESADAQDQTGQDAADGTQDADGQDAQQQTAEPNRATSVRVVNGSGIAGYAGQQAAVLQQAGYTSVEAANPASEALPAGNVVWYQNETDLATANDVAATLGIADVQQVSGLAVPVVVMLMN